MSSTGGGGAQSLAFRVMRLCRPSFHVETPLRLDPLDLIAGEDLFDPSAFALAPSPTPTPARATPISATASVDSPSSPFIDLSFSNRFHLHNPFDAMGLSSLLLPQSFGALYLGETFCSHISINNCSNLEVKDVIIKAEIQTERQRILLLDTTKSPVESIRAGGRYDFIVEHDVKELGLHTLVCTAFYFDGDGDRKHVPQFFKFVVANPLSVRTRVRTIKETTIMEACIENHTKSNLFMDQVDFEPALHWAAKMLEADENPAETELQQTREPPKSPVIIKSGGGIRNYLCQLELSSTKSTLVKSNILGKLQITWRTNLGEPGCLQTQQILGSPISHKVIDLRVIEVPSSIMLNRLFMVHLNLFNLTDRRMGPFEVYLSQGDTREEKVVLVNGLQVMVLPQVESFSSTDFNLNLIATKLGVQNISGITVYDPCDKRICDPSPDIEIFVGSD